MHVDLSVKKVLMVIIVCTRLLPGFHYLVMTLEYPSDSARLPDGDVNTGPQHQRDALMAVLPGRKPVGIWV